MEPRKSATCLLLAVLLHTTPTYSQENNWLISQFEQKSAEHIDSSATGIIDGQEYLTIVANRPSADIDYNPVIIVAKKTGSEYKILTTIDLELDNPSGYQIEIKNNSIFIKNSLAHHGVHNYRYQFKKVNSDFVLIGIETQSIELGCYSGDDSPRCDTYEAWSGVSYNFLTTTALCWKKNLRNNAHNKKNNKSDMDGAMFRFERLQQPNGAVRHQVKLPNRKHVTLVGFNFYHFKLPDACYFDAKNKLHITK